MSKVLFLSHGGGPLPLLQPDSHKNMINYFKNFSKDYKPKAIVVFSAHLETDAFTLISNHPEGLLFDYHGFPKESYGYSYNPPIDSDLANRLMKQIKLKKITITESQRGFDHGVFIPLMIMYPLQDIPVIQISLKKGLNELEHIQLGQALSAFKDDNILFIGSGSSFHNLSQFFNGSGNDKNTQFHDGLIDILTKDISENERINLLVNWKNIPNASFAHPRSEHLIPLLITYGIKQTKATISFDDTIMNKRIICALW